ncbi:MAG: hypothetical protein DMG62_21790 [Acidobacteria bacterium]|nr:MAG: hypothetical protein DMG62_21790 [Acidobacteriota bacterium]
MKKLLLLPILLAASLAHATTWNTNGTAADVQAKINGAVANDTVVIPAGTFSWTTQVTVNKNITLKGQTGIAQYLASRGTRLPGDWHHLPRIGNHSYVRKYRHRVQRRWRGGQFPDAAGSLPF